MGRAGPFPVFIKLPSNSAATGRKDCRSTMAVIILLQSAVAIPVQGFNDGSVVLVESNGDITKAVYIISASALFCYCQAGRGE